MPPFAERVRDALGATGPLCVGIDPSAALLGAWGLDDDPGGLRELSLRCVDALAGRIAVVKPQVAFYERHGAAGMRVLEELIAAAHAAGILVVADAKRGDVGSTMEAYAEAWLDGPLAADAVTATAYVGFGALAPMVAAARRCDGGVLVVVASSNPEGRVLQSATTADGTTVEDHLLAEIAAENRRSSPEGGVPVPPGAVGAVFGATREPPGVPLAGLGGVILAPGVGAQGATPADVGRLFGDCPGGSVLPSASRALLDGGQAALADRAVRLRDELAAFLP